MRYGGATPLAHPYERHGEYTFIWQGKDHLHWHCKIADNVNEAFAAMLREEYVTIPPNTVMVVISYGYDRGRMAPIGMASINWFKALPVTPPMILESWFPGQEKEH